MTKLDYYERHLLGLLFDACQECIGLWYSDADEDPWTAYGRPGEHYGSGRTPEEAIKDALNTIGVQVPERPSEEAVRLTQEGIVRGPLADPTGLLEYLRGLSASDPLLAAAVLEAER